MAIFFRCRRFFAIAIFRCLIFANIDDFADDAIFVFRCHLRHYMMIIFSRHYCLLFSAMPRYASSAIDIADMPLLLPRECAAA